jgi:hypothetical protein
MPDSRRHRGLAPEDPTLFGTRACASLARATAELSWLFGRGYKPLSSLKLVGDRHQLTQRQRSAVARAACADAARDARLVKRVSASELRGETLFIDGFNVLTTLEVALGGGVVLVSRDGVLRDIAGVHGSYRRVEETDVAFALIAELTQRIAVRECRWLLDRPVSNSGRLCSAMLAYAEAQQLPWTCEVVPDPDPVLMSSTSVIASADGEVLDHAARWFNLTRELIPAQVPHAYLVDLERDASSQS